MAGVIGGEVAKLRRLVAYLASPARIRCDVCGAVATLTNLRGESACDEHVHRGPLHDAPFAREIREVLKCQA